RSALCFGVPLCLSAQGFGKLFRLLESGYELTELRTQFLPTTKTRSIKVCNELVDIQSQFLCYPVSLERELCDDVVQELDILSSRFQRCYKVRDVLILSGYGDRPFQIFRRLPKLYTKLL